MKKIIVSWLSLLLVFALATISFAQVENQGEQKTYSNNKYGISFLYPDSWEIVTGPDPLRQCEFVINMRPSSWLSSIASAEFRRDSDFPVQIYIYSQDFNSLAKYLGYEKVDGEWKYISSGIEWDTSAIKGAGWSGIEGEAPFKSIERTGEQGPELYLDQALISIGQNKSIFVIMEHIDATWDIRDFLNSLVIKQTQRK